MKNTTTKLLTFATFLLLTTIASANTGPASVTYASESSKGPVVFDHESHADFVESSCDNVACHGPSATRVKIVLNKKTAHGKMCRTCHSHTNKIEGDVIAPIKCSECHLLGDAAPKLCRDGRQSSDCKKCHK